MTSKRDYNLISGIEESDKTEKRIKSYLYDKFKNDPKLFFLEWDMNDMLISDGHKWTISEEIKKVCVFLNISYIKDKHSKLRKKHDILTTCKAILKKYEEAKDKSEIPIEEKLNEMMDKIFELNAVKTCTLSLEIIHSPIKRLRGMNEKRYKSNRKETISFFLMSIHNADISKSLPSEALDMIFKHFNQQKSKYTDDIRLLNVLTMVSLSIAKGEGVFSLNTRNIFFNNNIKKYILPESYNFLVSISKHSTPKISDPIG